MRRKLYVSLILPGLVVATAVLVTEATKGSGSIVSGWQIPLLVIGVGASIAFMFVAAWTIAYEIGRATIGRAR